jgi:hypothetical protein
MDDNSVSAFEAGIYKLLKEDATVSSLISGRIFGSRVPKGFNNYPCLVWQTAATQEPWSIQGASGFRIKRIQFDAYATTYAESVAVADAARAVLKNFRGNLPADDSSPPVSSFVNGVVILTDMDFPYEPGASGYVFRHMFEAEVQYQEP